MLAHQYKEKYDDYQAPKKIQAKNQVEINDRYQADCAYYQCDGREIGIKGRNKGPF
jgi:hypothetical protein